MVSRGLDAPTQPLATVGIHKGKGIPSIGIQDGSGAIFWVDQIRTGRMLFVFPGQMFSIVSIVGILSKISIVGILSKISIISIVSMANT